MSETEKGSKVDLPEHIKVYLFNHQIGVKKIKKLKSSIYFRDTNDILFCYSINQNKLVEFVNSRWFTLWEPPKSESITLV